MAGGWAWAKGTGLRETGASGRSQPSVVTPAFPAGEDSARADTGGKDRRGRRRQGSPAGGSGVLTVSSVLVIGRLMNLDLVSR